MRQLRQTTPYLALLASTLVVALSAPIPAASAAPGPVPAVNVVRASDYVPLRGDLGVGASIALAQPARTVTVRFRVLSSNDTLIHQHTESRYRLPAGTVVVELKRSSKALGLREGTYRLEVRVEASGSDPVAVAEPLLVVDDTRAPVAVAVLIRVRGTPSIGPEGRLESDPATATATRDEAVAAAQLHAIRPDIAFTLAVPPVILDDWRRIAQGYTPPGSDAEVSLDATVPATYRAASRALADAARSGLQFAGVPYAEPDIRTLEAMGALDDLSAQMGLGSRVASSTLHTATPGAVLDGSPIRHGAARILEERRERWVLVSPDAVPQSGEATPATGLYRIEGSALLALVGDTRASALLSDPTATRIELLTHLFRRASSKKDKGQPVVATVEVGDGATTSVADLQATLAALKRVGWIKLVSAAEAAELRPASTLKLPEVLPQGDADSIRHWRMLAQARAHALALRAAAPPADADAVACERGIMLAEDRMWTGPALETSERYASAADRLAMSFLERLSLTAPDVTLSGTSGKVRVSLSNETGKVLALTIVAAPKDMRLLQDVSIPVSAPPGETLIAIPVEVRSSLKGTLGLRLLAGTVEVASARSSVAAGFIDRLVIVGTVVLVLLMLLWYIRSRGRQAVADLREATAARIAGGAKRRRTGHEEVDR